jgi:hypothetical protein
MAGHKEHTFSDRMEDAAKARAARLEKARAKDPRNDPKFAERQAERIRIAQERERREAERKSTKLADQQRLAAEAAAAEQARLEAEKASEEERRRQQLEMASRVVADEAARKAKRDARYAARKARLR